MLLCSNFFIKTAKSQCPANAYAYASVYPICPGGCGVLLKDWPEGVIVNIYGGVPLNIITSVAIPGVYGNGGVGSAFTCVPCDVPLVYAATVPGATSGCVITTLGIVPIAISSVTVFSNTNFSQTIKWITANDNGGIIYDIQKSLDGIEFATIGSVNGLTGINNKYNFTDRAIVSGNVSYRVKIKEASGEISYSKIVMAKGKANTGVTIFPNPATDIFKINIASQLLPATVQLINAQGQQVYEAKTNNVVFEINKLLSRGLYAVRVFAKNGETITGMVLKK